MILKDLQTKRMIIKVAGAVQGVGFRPFAYRLAVELGLKGYVINTRQGVEIDVEGSEEEIKEFLRRLQEQRPPRSIIEEINTRAEKPLGYEKFEIKKSDATGEKTVCVQPDIATCDECLKEIFDPTNRRYLYPFTNCTNCGPRFSIILSVPYDRANTTMRSFQMCEDCAREYEDPQDRRYHAQPNACPKCGPRVELWDETGRAISSGTEAILRVVEAIRHGKIVAIKGLGGFHLMADPANDNVVLTLRNRKRREEKPFALMFPNLEEIKVVCAVNEVEEKLLRSPQAPIVLLKRLESSPLKISNFVAPNNPYLGVMLPYTPLHHILMRFLDAPVVATSGNLSDEPICTDKYEALERLKGIADLFLVHNRPIARHIDDSVVCVINNSPLLLRRARGYAPLPVKIKQSIQPVLAVGAHLKNTVALGFNNYIFISQHIGDLETEQAFVAFRRSVEDLPRLYEKNPQIIVCDRHPDYISTNYARQSGLPVHQVQHHYAHILSCMAENGIQAPVLGVAWDGTGYGMDGTIWGGEFLIVEGGGFQRVAHFKSFRLPGGEIAAREPRRSALGVLFSLAGKELLNLEKLPTLKAFTETELKTLLKLLENEKHSPLTSSAGRLFDAVASIIGVRQRSNYEGQSAMELEYIVGDCPTDQSYPMKISESDSSPEIYSTNPSAINSKNKMLLLDYNDMIWAIINDYCDGVSISKISAKFHNTMVKLIVEVAKIIKEPRVVISGGCFQNRYLTGRCMELLQESGFEVYTHRDVPPNDGGIAIGQIYALALKD